MIVNRDFIRLEEIDSIKLILFNKLDLILLKVVFTP